MMTKREINFFSETLSSGNFTEFLNLFIPGLYDKGTIVTDVLDPNLRKIDTWAKTVDEQFNKICGQNIEGFIEDVGTKKENNFYLSKNKNGLYLCNGETSSTDPDDTVAFTKMDINTIYELITSLQTSNDKKLDKGTVPASLNSAEKIVAALQGNGGLKFDENLLYLNDEGTKKVGHYYLDRLADGIFECLEQTEETVNNSAKFRDISNKASADRLDNLLINKTGSIQFEIPFVAKGNKHLINKLTDKGGIIFMNFLYEVQAVTGSDNVRVWLDDNFYGYLPCLNAGTGTTIISGFLIINKKIGEKIYIDSSLNDINPSNYNLYGSACFFEL